MKYGYMGLTNPLDTQWSDGRMVTVYPDGRVVSSTDGRVIREADTISTTKYDEQPKFSEQNLMLFGMFIIGVIAVIALAKR